RDDASKRLTISGYHDATGDADKNMELAKARAQAVQQALEASGVSADRIDLRKPQTTTGGANEQEARRVEVRFGG
ncbi:MAG TPA: OmpA family protein, partial [Burkholderiaceae bacterium]|nr:OmpA family protein [Burkholderiaceae bacterium]